MSVVQTHSPNPGASDVEKQRDSSQGEQYQEKQSAFKSLGILDRFLAVWIFVAMAVGIILGNFVPSTGPTLQKGTFVSVSIPIGQYGYITVTCSRC